MILVTGGAGYIGSHIVKTLVKNNYEVVVLDNLSTGHNINGDCYFIYGDITNEEQVLNVFKECPIDLVIHCAAKKDITESIDNPIDYYSNNVAGTINVLKAMKQNNVDKIIFSSTACVYKNAPAKEDDKVIGNNPYAKSKLMDEDIIKDSGLKYVIFRFFNVAGHDKDGVMLIQKIKSGDKITIYGDDYDTRDGTCIRDYVHVEDIAEAHIKAIEYLKEHESNTFNLGTSEGYTIKEICDIAGIDYEIGARRESDVIVSIADNTKAIEVLGWKPIKTIEDILKEE